MHAIVESVKFKLLFLCIYNTYQVCIMYIIIQFRRYILSMLLLW